MALLKIMNEIKKISIGNRIISLEGIKCVEMGSDCMEIDRCTNEDNSTHSDVFWVKIFYESGLSVKISEFDGIPLSVDANGKYIENDIEDKMNAIKDKIMELALPGRKKIPNIFDLI